jgi:hypothetical protein
MFYFFFRPVSCVPNIACVSGMSILWFSLKLMFSVLCFVVVEGYRPLIKVVINYETLNRTFYMVIRFDLIIEFTEYCLCLWNVHSLVFPKAYVFCVVLCCC